MRCFHAGALTVHALGGCDGQGGGSGPAIVLCHGHNVPGNDLALLARRTKVGQDVRWFFPEGPLAVGTTDRDPGRGWYAIDTRGIEQRLAQGLGPYPLEGDPPPGLSQAVSCLGQCLDALVAEHGVLPQRTIIGGFSQGAVVATALALQYRPILSGLAVLSGRLVAMAQMSTAMAEIGSSLHVFQSHGASDQVIPIDNGEALRRAFEAYGTPPEWFGYEGGHEITREVCEALARFCTVRFAQGA